MSTFKPMLACDWKLDKVKYPVLVQPKVDGVHMVNRDGQAMGRSLKKLANKFVTEKYSQPEYHGFCGELIAGNNVVAEDLCRFTTSAVNRIGGEPLTMWLLFDYCTDETKNLTYMQRMQALKEYTNSLPEHLQLGLHIFDTGVATSLEDLLTMEEEILNDGFEGVILRNDSEPYKYGRADGKGQVWRIKRFIEEEILVTSIKEGRKNNNKAKTNELGRTERSSNKENTQPNGEVGTIVGNLLKDIFDPVSGKLLFAKGLEIDVSPGEMTQAECKYYFENQDKIVGHVIKFKSFPKGVKDKPRFATYVTHRFDADLVMC